MPSGTHVTLENARSSSYNTFMHDDMTTVLTIRGQTSVPAKVRRTARLKPGQRLHWQQLSDGEFRVTVETDETAPGPLAVLGWARRFHAEKVPRTDEAMAELRAGETE